MLLSEDIMPLSVLGCKRSGSQWDYIGRGVAYHLEAFCNRVGESFHNFAVVYLLRYELRYGSFHSSYKSITNKRRCFLPVRINNGRLTLIFIDFCRLSSLLLIDSFAERELGKLREVKPNVSSFTENNSLEICKTHQASYTDLKRLLLLS